MIKKDITFTDFDGNEQTETHYFHLSKADIIEMEMSEDGGLSGKLQKIGTEGTPKEILNHFKQFIAKSYGHRPEGTTKFIKNEARTEEFMSSEAYSELFYELVTDAKAASNFIVGLIPASHLAEVQAEIAKKGVTNVPFDWPNVEEKGKAVVEDLNREGSNEKPNVTVKPLTKTPEQLQQETVAELAGKLSPEQLKMLSDMANKSQS